MNKIPMAVSPGVHTGRILAIDPARGSDFTAGVLARIGLAGDVVIEHVWLFDSMSNYTLSKAVLPVRAQRNRHHKRKSQPNRGPQGGNQW